jgi:hypothetical protein
VERNLPGSRDRERLTKPRRWKTGQAEPACGAAVAWPSERAAKPFPPPLVRVARTLTSATGPRLMNPQRSTIGPLSEGLPTSFARLELFAA